MIDAQRPRCSREGYERARERVSALGYGVHSVKWAMFWAGFRAAVRGQGIEARPVPDVTDIERKQGRRTPHTRGAWLEGFDAGVGA